MSLLHKAVRSAALFLIIIAASSHALAQDNQVLPIDEKAQSALSEKLRSVMNSVNSLPIKINGFISVGAGVSDVTAVTNPLLSTSEIPNYFGITDQVNLRPYTNAGIQFELDIKDDIALILQLIARGSERYDVEANWAYLRYQPNENWNIQVGRIRVPTFLLSEYIDVGYAYPWIHPPAEVYNQLPIPNVTGAQVIYTHNIGDFDFEITPFIATTDILYPIRGVAQEFQARNIIGGEVSVGNENITVRGSFLHTQLSAPNFPLTLPSPPYPANLTFPAVHRQSTSFFGIGLQANWKKFEMMAEYTRRLIDGYLSDSESWYVMLGYQIGKFTPNVTYSQIRTLDKGDRAVTGNPLTDAFLASTLNSEQHTIEVGVRYDVTNFVALKASYQRVTPDNGTAGLFSINPGKSVNVFNLAVQAAV